MKFTQEQIEQIEDLAGVGYSSEHIAVFLEVDVPAFVLLAKEQNSQIYRAIKRGMLQAEYLVNKSTLDSAKSGNATQTQRLDKIQYALKVEEAKRRIFYEPEGL